MIERLIVGPMGTNSYIYSNGKKGCIVIDPGGDPDKIAASINMLKLVPSGIVLTHGHFDHTGGVHGLQEIYNTDNIKIPVAIHAADRHFLGKKASKTNLQTLADLGVEAPEEFQQFFDKLPEADIILKEGDGILETGLVVLETPGHTKGSVCLYGEKDGVLFSGDSLFFMGIGRTDLPGGSERILLDMLRSKILTLPPETRVFPGHGLDTTIERELVGNPFLR
jgi:glyoxylase-like metal-dependent hydrolase (beta-lactamase superfamily II)